MAQQYPQRNSQPIRKPNVFDFTALHLRGVPWITGEGAWKQTPILRFYLINGIPQFKMYSNKPGDPTTALTYKFEEFPSSIMPYHLFVSSFDEILKSNEPNKISITFTSSFIGGVRSPEPKPIGAITIGREASGVVYLSVNYKKGEPPAIFKFLPNLFQFKIVGADGEVLSEANMSTKCATNWIKTMSNLVENVLATFVPPEKNSESSPKVNTPNNDFDDDISF